MTTGFNAECLRAALRQAVAGKSIVGCVVAVSYGADAIHVEAAGLADREARMPMTGEAVFRLASLTKAVIGVLALTMVEHGEIDLADPVTRWLPWFSPVRPGGEQGKILVADLLTHRSGLGYGFNEPRGGPYRAAGISDGLDSSGLTLEQNMRRLAAIPLLDDPGTRWRYSLSTDLLGLLLEVAARRPLGDLVAERILRPLGMDRTAFIAASGQALVTPYADGPETPVRMAKAHAVAMGAGEIRFSPGRAYDASAFPSGGTGLVGTATDYVRFLDAIRRGGNGILSAAMARRFATDALDGEDIGFSGSGMGWGMGAAIMRDPAATGSPLSAGSWLWGGVYGNSYWVDPVRQIAVVALTNTALAGMTGTFPDEIKRAVYAGLEP
ncbi:MAG: serine hydrolase domain-containing protein [Pseudomonadota bacterium]